MKELKEKLNKYSFFLNKKYELIPIQKYGKKTKFLVDLKGKKFIVLADEKTVQKYEIRIEKLGQEFTKRIGLQYISDDHQILVLTYYGQGEGVIFSKLETKNEEEIAIVLKKEIDKIHEIRRPFVNVSTRFDCKNWYEFIRNYTETYVDYAVLQKDIKKEEATYILREIDKRKEDLLSRPMCMLHGDINEDNVCFLERKKEVYLIDFDDFLIGDILYEYARMFQYLHIKPFQILKEKYYKDIEKNPLFLIYTLRNQLLGYCFEKRNQMDFTYSLASFYKTLEQLKKEID